MGLRNTRRVAVCAFTAIFLFALLVLSPIATGAQTDSTFNPLVFGTSLSIGLSPQYPKPGEAVHLTAAGTGIDLSSSALVWRVGGKIIAQGVGVVSADMLAGPLGSTATVEVDVAVPDGTVRSAKATIAPAELDVLVGSDSYTPPFYRGRSLPSAGTNLIVQTFARFKRANGTFVPNSDINYAWKRDGEVLGNISGRGRDRAVIPVLHLFTDNVITVSAVSSDGTLSGEERVTVPSTIPTLDLYEDHPLYGILYNRALPASAFIPESEMAFAAVPYFASAASADDPALSYAWRVNDFPVTSSAAAPSVLTINADNSSGQAHVSLEVTHATNFYLSPAGEWDVTLASKAATQDAFHAPTQ